MMKRAFKDSAALCLFIALAFYALLGAPTADNPGWVEGIIFIFILCALGIAPFLALVQFDPNNKTQKPNWLWSGKALFLFCFVTSLIVMLINNNGIHNAIRDFIGFAFLLIPLFLAPFFQTKQRTMMLITASLLIGLSFSLRTLYPDTILNIRGSELLYLANSPLVLFASIYFIGFGAKRLFDHVTIKNAFIFAFCLIASLICLLAMMQDIRRASFVAVIISALIFAIIGFVQKPIKTLLPLALLGVFVFSFQQDIMEIIHQITLKTSQVGLNMRLQELQAVWQTVSGNGFTLLFGQGWGATFESPAVGGLPVTFTHSLLSAVLLKSGMIGLLLCLIYLFFIFEKLASVVFINPIAGIAFFWPFMIATLFYASYKSLDFGLLLTLIIIWHNLENPKSDPDLNK